MRVRRAKHWTPFHASAGNPQTAQDRRRLFRTEFDTLLEGNIKTWVAGIAHIGNIISMLSVNNHPIDEEAIETEFKRLLRVCSERRTAEEVQKQIPALRRQAKDHAINRQLLLEEARRREIDVSNEEINFFLAQLPNQQSPETAVNKRLKKTSLDSDNVRDSVRNACQIEKLINAVTASVPEPTNDEALKYLKESEFLPANNKQDSELMQKLIDKTRRLVRHLHQNQALIDFIAELRKQAVISPHIS